MNHTKAPWTFDAETAGIWGDPEARFPQSAGTTAQGIQVCSLDYALNGIWPGEEEYQANARLIAASPELLEALEDCVERLEAYQQKGLSFPLTVKKARAALAKARGEA